MRAAADHRGEPGAARARVLDDLRRAPGRAATATVLAASVRVVGADAQALAAALDELERAGDIVIVVRPSPDPHLAGAQLHTVALVEDRTPAGALDASRRAEACGARFLRDFLATHRCG